MTHFPLCHPPLLVARSQLQPSRHPNYMSAMALPSLKKGSGRQSPSARCEKGMARMSNMRAFVLIFALVVFWQCVRIFINAGGRSLGPSSLLSVVPSHGAGTAVELEYPAQDEIVYVVVVGSAHHELLVRNGVIPTWGRTVGRLLIVGALSQQLVTLGRTPCMGNNTRLIVKPSAWTLSDLYDTLITDRTENAAWWQGATAVFMSYSNVFVNHRTLGRWWRSLQENDAMVARAPTLFGATAQRGRYRTAIVRPLMSGGVLATMSVLDAIAAACVAQSKPAACVGTSVHRREFPEMDVAAWMNESAPAIVTQAVPRFCTQPPFSYSSPHPCAERHAVFTHGSLEEPHFRQLAQELTANEPAAVDMAPACPKLEAAHHCPRILFMTVTTPHNYETRLRPSVDSWVQEVWNSHGKMNFVAFSNESVPDLHVRPIDTSEYVRMAQRNGSAWRESLVRYGRDWEYVHFQLRFCRVYAHLFQSDAFVHEGERYNWLVVLDDDSLPWPANIQRFLESFDSSTPHFIGWAFDKWSMVSGAGAMISAAAMQEFSRYFNSCSEAIATHAWGQDAGTGHFMQKAGVPATPEHRIYMTSMAYYEDAELHAFPLIAHHMKGRAAIGAYATFTENYKYAASLFP
ncbi:MAG: hypothetical protein EOO65_02285 [Methanosarcinales archaeon]|nr:MAG: hypothetical protein EOO65_02285 [Methanosarcinales archaeon]